MHIRNWLITGALGLAILGGFSWALYSTGYILGVQSGEYQAHSNTYSRNSDKKMRETCGNLNGVSQVECIARVIDSTNQHKRAEKDLVAQTEMALWAFWMLVVTTIMALITLIGVYYVWRTLVATQSMAADTREIGEAQVRAYVSITSFKMSLEITGGQARWSGQIELTNAGQSPSRNTNIVVGGDRFLADSHSSQRDIPAGGTQSFSSINTSNTINLIKYSYGPGYLCAGIITLSYQDVFSKTGSRHSDSFTFTGLVVPSGEPIDLVGYLVSNT